jgi:predicted nucleic acid-binding protein
MGLVALQWGRPSSVAQRLCQNWSRVGDILAASKTEEDAKISFWDALIITMAAKTGAIRLVSEDLNPEQSIAGVTRVNPFVEIPPAQENGTAQST